MTDALSLDPAVVEAQLSAPVGYVHPSAWHARRGLTWGASEVAALFVALDVEDPAQLGSYARRAGKRYERGRWREPRIILEKAGIVPPLKAGKVADRGLNLERALIAQWRMMVARGTAAGAEMVDARSIAYVPDALPRELIPLVNRHCPVIAVSPDVWARDVLDTLGAVELKCSVRPYGGAKRQHVIQLHAQADTMSAEWLAVVEGEGWGADWRDHAGEPGGPIRTWPVDMDRALIATIREVCTTAMRRVEELREATREAA